MIGGGTRVGPGFIARRSSKQTTSLRRGERRNHSGSLRDDGECAGFGLMWRDEATAEAE